MSYRLVATPIDAPLRAPEPRTGGLDPSLRDAFVAAPGRDALLDRLSRPDALAVTTGQQPGLFGGPLYTIYKAVSAAAVARQLEAAWGRPVVPVFWSAGDDHDHAEASHAAWPGADGSVVQGALPQRESQAPLTPMYREPLGQGVVPVLEQLVAALPGTEWRDDVENLLRRHYRADSTVAAAAAGLLAELLAPAGILVFDPAHPAAKRAVVPLLLESLRRADDLDRLLEAEDQRLKSRDVDAGVQVGTGATLVMYEGREGRDRLVSRGTGFNTRRSGESFSLAEVEELAARHPERFSGNVLLRPVTESALLPTVAYMAGPGELRYLALARALYGPLEVPHQVPLPRWSGMVVEARVDRVLDKYGATLEELLAPGQRLEARVVRSSLPDEAERALAAIREALGEQYEILAAAARAIDPTIEKPIRNLAQQAVNGTQDAEKRLLGHLKKRQAVETQQIARAREAVLPLDQPQERVFTIAPYLARFGPAFLTDLASTVQSWYAAGLVGPPVAR